MQLISFLKREIQNLPGESAHVEMFPLRARTSDAIKTAANYRLSAVLALIYSTGNSYRLILIERQSYEGNHSGQIGFPGGKKEEKDSSSLHAALRETHEEIGINPDDIELIGELTHVYIPVSNFLVHPFVGFLKSAPVFKPDEREVKSIITIDLGEIIDENNRIVTSVAAGNGTTFKNVPAFKINDTIIWGATALMINELRHILIKF